MAAEHASRSSDGNKQVVYYYDEEVGNFYYGQSHPMKPHRMRMTHSLIVNYGLFKKMEVYRPYRLKEREMTLFHADDYIHFLRTVTPDNEATFGTDLDRFNIDIDCPVFDGVYRFCQISAGGSVGGAYKLNHGLCDIAINWAGGLHHAKKCEASGFCYVNDIVLAILELLKFHERVLYIDVDIHHGDGVEEAFYTTDRVMTLSFHKYGDFFPGTGAIEDFGVGDGKYYSINIPLSEGMTDEAYQYCFKPVIKQIMDKYAPGAVVLQLGADSLAGDRLGCFNLTIAGHGECVRYLQSFNVPLMLLGGGGYTLRNVARCWTLETSIACNVELDAKLPYHEYYEYFAPDYSLATLPTNMLNMNKEDKLDRIISTTFEYLKHVEPRPSVSIQDSRLTLGIDSKLQQIQAQIGTKLEDEMDEFKHERDAKDDVINDTKVPPHAWSDANARAADLADTGACGAPEMDAAKAAIAANAAKSAKDGAVSVRDPKAPGKAQVSDAVASGQIVSSAKEQDVIENVEDFRNANDVDANEPRVSQISRDKMKDDKRELYESGKDQDVIEPPVDNNNNNNNVDKVDTGDAVDTGDTQKSDDNKDKNDGDGKESVAKEKEQMSGASETQKDGDKKDASK